LYNKNYLIFGYHFEVHTRSFETLNKTR